MEEITVTGTSKWSDADIKARLTEKGGVTIWFEYKGDSPISGQQRHEFICSPEEWDRFVAWVEWQRRNRGLTQGES